MNRKLVGLIIGIILAGSALPAVGVSYNKNTSTNIYVDNTNVVQSIGNDDDWSMFHHDLAHTGFTSSVAPNTNNTFWNSTAGAGSCPFDSLIMPSPTIVDGKVYVGAHWENKLYCFDALDGTELWNFTAGSYVFSTPAVTNGRVYFGSFDRKIYCLDAETGDFIWNFSASNLAWSSPAVVNDRVYVAGGMDVFCLNATGNGDGTTTKIWQYATDGVVYSSPAVVDDRVYIGSNDHRVYCLDAEGSGDGTTTEHWNYTTDGSVWSSPAVENGYVYIGSHDTNLYCLNTETGIPEWIYPTDFAIMASPAIAYGKIYIASMNGNVYCVDSLTGFPEWEKQIGTDIGSSPAVANDKAYIGETLIGVFCLDASDGTIFWNYTTEPYAGCDSSPAIVDGILYIASYDGNLYAFKDLNSPPSKPSVSGPSAAAPGFDLNFTAVSIDLDGDSIFYNFSWGDGNYTGWFGPFPSGENVSVTYSWDIEGEYEVKVQAKDTTEQESPWTDPHLISISKQIQLDNIKSGFVYFRLGIFNESYAYVYLLDSFGASVVLSSGALDIKATGTEAVDTVNFTAFNLISGDNSSYEDDNGSDGFSASLELPLGLYQLTVSAFDADENLIGIEQVDYLVFISRGGSEEPFDRVGRFRQRLRDCLIK